MNAQQNKTTFFNRFNATKKKKIFDSDRSSEFIPLVSHLTPTIGHAKGNMLVGGLSLVGTPFESKTENQLEIYSAKIARSIQRLDSRFCVHSIWLKRGRVCDWRPRVSNVYANNLGKNYKSNLSKRLSQNLFYIVLTMRYMPTQVGASEKKKATQFERAFRADALPIFEDKLNEVIGGLTEYTPKILGLREGKGKTKYSELGELYSDILYGERNPVPVRPIAMDRLIMNRRLSTWDNRDFVEITHHSKTTVAGVIGIKEYQESTDPTMTVGLDQLDFDFNFIQSFAIINKTSAKKEIERQEMRMTSTEDDGLSQLAELTNMKDDLASNRIVCGHHNGTFTAFAPSTIKLNSYITEAKNALDDMDGTFVREDLALEGQYYAQLPAQMGLRARPSFITNVNYAAFTPMYSVSSGTKTGLHWGDAVAPLISLGGTEHYFSPHPKGSDVGSMLLIGMTGSGKTVVMNFILSMLQRDGFRHVFFDKDKGAKIAILANGGVYHDLEIGVPTGLNPFALPDTGANRTYLGQLVSLMIGGADSTEKVEIAEAIDMVFDSITEGRTVNSLNTFLEDGSIRTKLSMWCKGGRYEWVFCNDVDRFSFTDVNGIDMTSFLDNDDIRTPIMSYLFHRIDDLIDGQPLSIWIDEFSKALGDDYFVDWVDNKLKVVRKQNVIVVCATQSPRHALESKISSSIMEQMPTKILLPNETATKSDYVDGFKLTEAEWATFETITKESRIMLVKQQGEGGYDEDGVFARLPLNGLDDDLSILSGTTRNVRLLEAILKQKGDLPYIEWAPIFHAHRA